MIAKLILLQFISWSAPVAENQELFKQVIERRSEMEELAREVKLLQESFAQRALQSESQVLEVDSQIQSLVLKKAQLEQKKSVLKSSLGDHVPDSRDTNQIVSRWLKVLNDNLDQSLHFELSERNRKLQEIEKRMKSGEPAISLLWSLWTLSNEELQLTRGVHYSLQKDEISLLEKEVVRLGMWRIYERNEGQYSLLEKKNKEWLRNPIRQSTDLASVKQLFDAAQKKNFQKVFTLPQGDQE
jgi:hypothetical protein